MAKGNSRAIRAARAFVEIFADDSKLVSGLRRAQARLKEFGSTVRRFGIKMMQIGGLMLAPIIASSKVFADFERQMANVATMLDEPEKYMERFTSAVQRMAAQFGQSTATLTKGLYDILSASIAPEHALEVLEVSSRAAIGGLTDTSIAADAITTILNAYNMSATKAAWISDILFTTVKRGKLTFEELASNIGLVVSASAIVGVSLEEVGAMIATMTRAGVKSDNAITALANILKQFLSPTDESANAARELGFELNSTTLQAEGLLGVIKKLSGASPETIAKIFPNIRALRGVLPILQNAEGFAHDLELMGDAAGSSNRAFMLLAATSSFRFNQLKESLLNVGRAIGEAVLPMVNKLLTGAIIVSEVIRKFVQENKELVVWLAKVAAAITVAGASLVAFGIGSIILAKVIGLLIVMSGVIFAIVPSLGLVAVAIAGIAFQLLRGTNGVKRAVNRFSKLFNDLRDDVSQVFSGISERIKAGDIEGAAKIAFYGIKLAWVHVWHGLETIFEGVRTRLAEDWLALANVMSNTWAWLKSRISIIMTELVVGIKTAWTLMQDFIAKRMVELWGMVDPSIDVEGTKRQLEEMKNQELSDIEKVRKADRAANGKSYDEQVKQNDALLVQRLEQLRQIHSAEKTEIEERLAAAKEEYRLAVKAIRERKKELDEEQKKVEDGLSEFMNTMKSLGTFSVLNTLALQGVEGETEQIKLLKDIEKNTRPDVGDETFP